MLINWSAMDRRVQRTRKLIIETFMELLRDKGFEKITVNDIAARGEYEDYH